MTRLDDIRKGVEGTLGQLTPARAQQLAKSLLEPGAAKEQVAKLAGDLIEWSQRNRERLTDIVRTEIADQLRRSGAATQAELDDLRRRVRALEKKAASPASGAKARGTAAKTTAKPAAKRTEKTTAKPGAAG
jgi:polyhydroxyalkanoate synthesis regulator phasin